MAVDASAGERFSMHDSALIVRVVDAEPAVGQWRAQHDASAAAGVPAHVTILYPFMRSDAIDEDTLDTLEALFRGFEPFRVSFPRIERVEGVIWLRPEPEGPFRDLTAAVWEAFPDHPPYGGRFDDVIPHLTVAEGDVEALPRQIEDAVRRYLPIATNVAEVELISFDGRRWGSVNRIPLGGPSR